MPFNTQTAQAAGSAGGDLGGSFPNPGVKGMQRVIASIRSANMNSTADQALTPPPAITKFIVTSILVTNASASLTTAAGGVYPAASKGGTPLVAAITTYTALTSSGILFAPALAGTVAATPYTAPLFLSLTLGQGSAATADIYVIGVDLT